MFGADATGGQRREVHVSLHRPLHVGGRGAEEQDHGGKCVKFNVKFIILNRN